MKASNRYLNLYGAPYDPEKPSQKTMLSNWLAAGTLSIIFATSSAPERKESFWKDMGLLSAGGGLGYAIARRKRTFSTHSIVNEGNVQNYVIDKRPGKETPPTSEALYAKVLEKSEKYDPFKLFPGFGAFGVLLPASYFYQSCSFSILPPFATALCWVTLSDLFERSMQYRQIEKRKWVISGSGNAEKEVNEEKAENEKNWLHTAIGMKV